MNSRGFYFHFVTLFPEVVDAWLTSSILGRALQRGVFRYETCQLRSFAHDRHRTVDDVAYGGGGGMVLKIEPLVEAVEALWKRWGRECCDVIYLSPAGRSIDQALIAEIHANHGVKNHLILICGHYEGVDQRFIDHWVNQEISLGDFVLTGGELPAVALVDAIVRQSAGTLPDSSRVREESFSLRLPAEDRPLLEYPHYTRPRVFRELPVPDVLLSGDHRKIQQWRLDESCQRTRKRRPDLSRQRAVSDRIPPR